MTYASGKVISHSLQGKFSTLLQFLPENLHHTQQKLNRMRLFIKKAWSKTFINGIVYQRVGFKCMCATISRQHTQLFCKLMIGATDSGRSMRGCNCGKNPTLHWTKVSWREISCFLIKKNFQSRQCFTISDSVFTFPLRILFKLWTVSFRKNTILAKAVSLLKKSERTQKSKIYLSNERTWSRILQYGPGTQFWKCLNTQSDHILKDYRTVLYVYTLPIYI